MNIVIYENNEVGAGHGLYIVNTDDFNKNVSIENEYLNAIDDALNSEDKWGYGVTECKVMLHNILESKTNVKELKPPCKIDGAVYIYCY